MSIDKIITANMPNFEVWQKQLDEHFEAQYHPGQLSSAEFERIFFQSNDLLMDMAANFFIYGKFKDKWDTSKCQQNYLGQNLLLTSEKMGITFHWGIQGNAFYMETYIRYAENIRYMTDDFWMRLLELKSLGDFQYSGSGYVSAQERPYYENKTSTVFQMMRNFMLYQVEKMNGTNVQQPSSMDIGYISLKWSTDMMWSELLEKSCNTFKSLYALNYQLWKISDLAKKKSEIIPRLSFQVKR